MIDDDFEARVLRFEQAWRQDRPIDIAEVLDHPPALSADDRARLLVELVCLDLEYRWRTRHGGSPARQRLTLEGYLARFPELPPREQLDGALIGEEYRVRRLWGDRPAHPEFLARFPARVAEIDALLRQIDCELDAELAVPRPIAQTAVRSPAQLDPIPVDPGCPLLSHHDLLLRRLIGAGRMGKVYQAWQHSAGREVTVKFLRKSFLNEPRIVQRFIGESRTIARLRHPNISDQRSAISCRLSTDGRRLTADGSPLTAPH